MQRCATNRDGSFVPQTRAELLAQLLDCTLNTPFAHTHARIYTHSTVYTQNRKYARFGASVLSRVRCKSVRERKSRVDINSFIAARRGSENALAGQFLLFPLLRVSVGFLLSWRHASPGITELPPPTPPRSFVAATCGGRP